MLQWILERVAGRGAAHPTPIGNVPATTASTSGLELSARRELDALLAVDPRAWLDELEQNEAYLAKFGETPSVTI